MPSTRLPRHLAGAVIPALTVLFAPAATPGDDHQPEPDSWHYVTPAAGAGMEHPPLQPVSLSAEKPADVSETATYRGARQLYAQLRYGSPGSTRVTVVIDETGPGEFDLYADKDRNRVIEPGELVPGTGKVRRLALSSETVREGAVDRTPRSVILRRGITGGTLGIATLGYLEGRATLDGEAVSVRRVDGDGNGLFADLRDRLWIDRDGDEEWDPFAEQFPHQPVMRLDGKRFAVRADAEGGRLGFEEVVGTGRVEVHLPSLPESARVQLLQVMLVGEDGSAFTIESGDGPATLPIGRYTLGSVSLSILDGKVPEPWNFTFSWSGGQERRWYEVTADAEVSVDPVGEFRFEVYPPDDGIRPGKEMSVKLRLYTGDGLLINSSVRGELEPYASADRYNCATVRLVSAGGALSTAKSGFV